MRIKAWRFEDRQRRCRAVGWPGILLAASAGCSGPVWNGRVEHWGELRQVMRDGRTEPRVPIRSVLATPHCYAIGALEGLTGEVTILDGTVWVSRVTEPGRVVSTAVRSPREQATILIAAWVPRWQESRIERDLSSSEFDEFVRQRSPRGAGRTFPFMIEGQFDALRMHVVNGRCLMGADPEADDGSFRRELPRHRGTLIGFCTQEPPGVLTHHGSRTHVHVLLGDGEPLMAHVESVGIRRGGVIRFPVASEAAARDHDSAATGDGLTGGRTRAPHARDLTSCWTPTMGDG